MQRLCLYCFNIIRSGRSDKKFCSSGCKDAYFNAIRSTELGEIRKIDGILKRNRRALKKLFESGKKDNVFRREELIKEGFEFGFQTHVAITKTNSSEITFCYDYGFRQEEEGTYKLFRSFPSVRVKDGGVLKISISQ